MEKISESYYKEYGTLSRYASFPYYYHKEDDAYFYGLTGNLKSDMNAFEHQVIQTDTLDFLSFKYYGRPDFYWVIADYNNIKDPFKPLKVKSLMIPSITNISYKGV